MRVEVVLTPAEIARLPGRDLSAATSVVFDVLRATSTMLTALSQGATQIHPVSTVEAARAARRSDYPDALLGGERSGLRIEGFDLGNSPCEYRAEAVAGRDIIMTTTNGTLALNACASAAKVYAGALLNLDALAKAIKRQLPAPAILLLVCAGSGEHFALEDGLAVGALLSRLDCEPPSPDAAMLLQVLYATGGRRPEQILRKSSNGQRLIELGLTTDVDYCAQVSVLDTVAVLTEGAMRIESA